MSRDLCAVRRELDGLLLRARTQLDDGVDSRELAEQLLTALSDLSAGLAEQEHATSFANVRRDSGQVGTQIGVIHGDATFIHGGGDWR